MVFSAPWFLFLIATRILFTNFTLCQKNNSLCVFAWFVFLTMTKPGAKQIDNPWDIMIESFSFFFLLPHEMLIKKRVYPVQRAPALFYTSTFLAEKICSSLYWSLLHCSQLISHVKQPQCLIRWRQNSCNESGPSLCLPHLGSHLSRRLELHVPLYEH